MRNNTITVEAVVLEYKRRQSIRMAAMELNISQSAVRKCLITAGVLDAPRIREIAELTAQGLSAHEIAEKLEVCVSCVDQNSPYTRGTYLVPSTTKNAEAIRRHRAKKTEQLSAL